MVCFFVNWCLFLNWILGGESSSLFLLLGVVPVVSGINRLRLGLILYIVDLHGPDVRVQWIIHSTRQCCCGESGGALVCIYRRKRRQAGEVNVGIISHGRG